MAEWIVHVPGESDRVVPLPPRSFVIGRAEGVDLLLPEKKASKRHAEVAPLPGAARQWVVTDLQTSNGTFVGERRVLRAVVGDGDTVRIGDSVLILRDPQPVGALAVAPKPSIVIASNLRVAPPPPAPPPPAPGAEAGPASVEGGASEPSQGLDDAAVAALRSRAAGRRAVRRGGLLVGIGVAALALAFTVGGAEAQRRARLHAETHDYNLILQNTDAPYEMVKDRVDEFRRDHPTSSLAMDLQRMLEFRSHANAWSEKAEADLDSIQRDLAVRPESEVLGRLLQLQKEVGEDSRFSKRIDILVAAVERQRQDTLDRERQTVEADASRALTRGDPSTALRRLHAFREGHPGLAEASLASIAKKEAEARDEAKRSADAALASAEKTPDPDTRRRLLVAAMTGLDETDDGERLRIALSRISGGTIAGASGATPGLPTGGSAPTAESGASRALLARAAEATKLARERHWAKAAAEFEALAATDASPRVKQEWAERAIDLQRVVALWKELVDDVAAGGEHGVRVPLAGGTFDVLSVDESGAKLHRGDKTLEYPWLSFEAADLLALFGRAKPTPDKHLALAVLAADLGERKVAVEHLIPLVSLDSHRSLAFATMAHRVEGRPSVPQGGYQVLDGDLVDQKEFTLRSEAKHVASLKAEAASLVEKVAADPVFKKVTALLARRDELDKRRGYALIAIFDERHWPYPHPASISGPYETVWNEIVRRTKLVADVWNEPAAVHVPRGGDIQKHVDRHAVIAAELEAKGENVDEMRASMLKYSMYLGETLSIRTIFRDADEKDLLAYNRWVMDVYNAARTELASAGEREETRITNDYRTMMGYVMAVEPGDDPIEAINDKNVIKILEKNKELNRVELHAVRIDDRLVHSARDHSEDMARRVYFAHESPADPSTGAPAMMPHERMAKAGYSGGGSSENICSGAGSPMDAHERWLHSSGHHRNILSNWLDQGVGQASNLWTQNFGSGGADAAVIPPGGATTPPAGSDDKKPDEKKPKGKDKEGK